jgi:hypothetical protein
MTSSHDTRHCRAARPDDAAHGSLRKGAPTHALGTNARDAFVRSSAHEPEETASAHNPPSTRQNVPTTSDSGSVPSMGSSRSFPDLLRNLYFDLMLGHVSFLQIGSRSSITSRDVSERTEGPLSGRCEDTLLRPPRQIANRIRRHHYAALARDLSEGAGKRARMLDPGRDGKRSPSVAPSRVRVALTITALTA